MRFKEWEKTYRNCLEEEYREYLKNVSDDDCFDIKTVEDYWTWSEEEYDIKVVEEK